MEETLPQTADLSTPDPTSRQTSQHTLLPTMRDIRAVQGSQCVAKVHTITPDGLSFQALFIGQDERSLVSTSLGNPPCRFRVKTLQLRYSNFDRDVSNDHLKVPDCLVHHPTCIIASFAPLLSEAGAVLLYKLPFGFLAQYPKLSCTLERHSGR